jgi:hypothetical protein
MPSVYLVAIYGLFHLANVQKNQVRRLYCCTDRWTLTLLAGFDSFSVRGSWSCRYRVVSIRRSASKPQ